MVDVWLGESSIFERFDKGDTRVPEEDYGSDTPGTGCLLPLYHNHLIIIIIIIISLYPQKWPLIAHYLL
jgi:hypothetical protein